MLQSPSCPSRGLPLGQAAPADSLHTQPHVCSVLEILPISLPWDKAASGHPGFLAPTTQGCSQGGHEKQQRNPNSCTHHNTSLPSKHGYGKPTFPTRHAGSPAPSRRAGCRGSFSPQKPPSDICGAAPGRFSRKLFKAVAAGTTRHCSGSQKQSRVGMRKEAAGPRATPQCRASPVRQPKPSWGPPPPFVGPRGCPAPSCCWPH